MERHERENDELDASGSAQAVKKTDEARSVGMWGEQGAR